MKINKIEVKNFKAIAENKVEFNGCSAIIVGGNNKGKTSLLRGLIDRLRGEKPEIILKEGEKKGFSIIELTDGSRIEWKFTEKTENFAYITKEGIKQTSGIIKTIGKRYFGNKFDIDKFLNSGPKDQIRELQKIVGLDFEEINNRYTKAFNERREANILLRDLRNNPHNKPEIIDKPDIETLYKEKKEIIEKNDKKREDWKLKNKEHLQALQRFNDEQDRITENHSRLQNSYEILNDNIINEFSEYIDHAGIRQLISSHPRPQTKKKLDQLKEPFYISIEEIENKIKESREKEIKYRNSQMKLDLYKHWMEKGESAANEAKKLDDKVKKIESEKKQMINDAKMPEEFEINEDGILYNKLPLSNNQISSSSKYIAALKLGAMVLGEVKTLHFDASFLDRDNLERIESWADLNGLQLLIERPDFDGGEIKFDLI